MKIKVKVMLLISISAVLISAVAHAEDAKNTTAARAEKAIGQAITSDSSFIPVAQGKRKEPPCTRSMLVSAKAHDATLITLDSEKAKQIMDAASKANRGLVEDFSGETFKFVEAFNTETMACCRFVTPKHDVFEQSERCVFAIMPDGSFDTIDVSFLK